MGIVRIKDVAKLISNKSSNIGKLPYLPLEAVQSWNGKIDRFQSNEDFSGDVSIFDKGDVLFNKLRPYLAKVVFADRTGGVSGEAMVLRPLSGVSGVYLFYKMISPSFIKMIDSITYGTKMPRVNPFDVLTTTLQLPSYECQSELAERLDYNCNIIDRKIDALKQKLTLLEEYKTALIHNAVTKGLDANGRRILDGTHAEEIIMKELIFEFCKSSYKAADGIPKGNYPFYTSSKVQSKFLNESQYSEDSIVMGTGGVANIHYAKSKFAMTGDCWAFSSRSKELTKFIYYRILSDLKLINDLAFKGQGLKHLEKDFVRNMRILLPSEIEVAAINSYVSEGIGATERLRKAINKKIDLLLEYKKSLINEAVSGEVPVAQEN